MTSLQFFINGGYLYSLQSWGHESEDHRTVTEGCWEGIWRLRGNMSSLHITLPRLQTSQPQDENHAGFARPLLSREAHISLQDPMSGDLCVVL